MRYNILIVDDSEIMQRVIERIIDMMGVPTEKILFAVNGIDALRALKTNSIDLMFTCINMPLMDGVELIATMQRDVELRGVPIIVVSAEPSENSLDRIDHPGVRAYIRKPFRPEIIRDVVTEVLGGPDWDEQGARQSFRLQGRDVQNG